MSGARPTTLRPATLRPATLRPATLRDVAAAARVSPMTVSNLINGRIAKMRPETRQRIEAEIARLGYRPHAGARGLRRAERLSIGMIVVDDEPTFLTDPLITHLVAGLGNHLSEADYGLVLQGVRPERFGTSMFIRDVRTDGLCAVLSGSPRFRRACLATLLALGQPVVLFQERAPAASSRAPGDLCVIRQDDRGGGRRLAEEVLDRGARRLLMLVPERDWPAMAERVAGVRAALRAADMHAAPGLLGSARLAVARCREHSFPHIQAALDAAIARDGRPDAVLAGNDQMGIAALKLLLARGWRVPDDVLVTGFNAFDFWHYTDPVLTTVRSPVYAMGAQGGREILARLREGRFSAPEIVYPVEFLRGGST